MKKKGFTIIELLAVIVIIAILSIGAMSGYSAMTKNSKEKAFESKVRNIETAAEKYAKETNISTKKTISVNKLVVLGYIQPDESTDTGLSLIENPTNGENIICNLIDINVEKNELKVKYQPNNKNCDIANEEEDSGKIKVNAYCESSTGTNLTETDGVFEWTKCNKVILRTNPNTGIDSSKIESVAFDYAGETKVGKNNRFATNNSKEINTYDNLFLVEGIDGVVNMADVGITYTMKDGKVYYRNVVVRIDKEKPTLTYILRNGLEKHTIPIPANIVSDIKCLKILLLYSDSSSEPSSLIAE